MYVMNARDKEEDMITKDFLENHFKHHNKLVLYSGTIPLTITKAWHLHLEGGHSSFDIDDCEDLEYICQLKGVTLKPVVSAEIRE